MARPLASVTNVIRASMTFKEEVALGLGKDRHDPLAGCLRIQVIAFTGDRQNEAWGEFILAAVAIEQLRGRA